MEHNASPNNDRDGDDDGKRRDFFCPNGDCQTRGQAAVQDSLMFSASLDAEPTVVSGGVHMYEHNSVYPKFYDSDTSFNEDENEAAVVVSTTQPLRPFFGSVPKYGINYSQWFSSDAENMSGVGDGGYTSATSVQRIPRRPVGTASSVLVGWNVISMLMNLSILALPFAIATGGILSIALIPIIAIMTGYTGKLLIDCMYEHSVHKRIYKTRIRLDYIEIGQDFANSEIGGRVINILQSIDMLCVCILSINVLAALCFEIFHQHLSIQICSLIGVTFALPTFFVNKLGCIAWMHLVGNASLIIGICLVEGFCIFSYKKWSISSIPLYDLEKLPITIGILICSFSVHSALPGIEQQMKKPKKYRTILALTFSLAVIVKIFIGSTNALFYGKETDQVITVDLQGDFRLGVSSSIFISISIICLFALPTFVILEGIDEAIAANLPFCRQNGDGYSIWVSLFNRIMVMGVSLTVAILVPHFALVMAFIGNTISTLLSLTIPCIFHLRLKKDRLRWYHYICNWLIIVLSISSIFIGVFFTGKELNRRLKM